MWTTKSPSDFTHATPVVACFVFCFVRDGTIHVSDPADFYYYKGERGETRHSDMRAVDFPNPVRDLAVNAVRSKVDVPAGGIYQVDLTIRFADGTIWVAGGAPVLFPPDQLQIHGPEIAQFWIRQGLSPADIMDLWRKL